VLTLTIGAQWDTCSKCSGQEQVHVLALTIGHGLAPVHYICYMCPTVLQLLMLTHGLAPVHYICYMCPTVLQLLMLTHGLAPVH
jgi:hypothetical protein